jgi:hypothetical protein
MSGLADVLNKKWGGPFPHSSGKPFDAVTETLINQNPRGFARLKSVFTSPAARRFGMYGAGALGVVGTVAAVDAIRDSLDKKIGREKAFKNMIKENPTLASGSPAHVKKVFNTLYTFNKDMAKDPLVAGSFTRRSLQFREEGLQPMDIKTLTEIRKHMSDSRGGGSAARGVVGDLGTISGLARFAG